MTKAEELDVRLKDAIQIFNREIRFHLDTFEQTHENEFLTKDDFEEIGRQAFYCLSSFREEIIEYLKRERA